MPGWLAGIYVSTKAVCVCVCDETDILTSTCTHVVSNCGPYP